jgi:hypothetical protein
MGYSGANASHYIARMAAFLRRLVLSLQFLAAQPDRFGTAIGLYVGELAGVFLIFIGFIRAKTPMREKWTCCPAKRHVISRISLSVQHLQGEEIRNHSYYSGAAVIVCSGAPNSHTEKLS